MNITIYILFIFLLLVRLFHGTNPANADSIHFNGLQPSVGGRLGPGIYFCEKAIADKVARHRGPGSYVIEVEIDVGNMKILPKGEADRNGNWKKEKYDTCQAVHPSWQGVTDHSFKEWCVTNFNRVKIIRYHQENAMTQFLTPPRTPIMARGKNTIHIQHSMANVVVNTNIEHGQMALVVN